MQLTWHKKVLSVILGFTLLSFLFFVNKEQAVAEENDNQVNPQQLPDSSFIYDTSIIDLSTADSYYDGQTVQVLGEVIGDNLRVDLDEGHRWITLNAIGDQKSNATIVVYMSKEAASRIDSYGKYGVVGTTLRVRGVYHLACSDHDGLSDIHAESVSVVQKGMLRSDTFDPLSFVPGVITVAIGLVLLVVFYFVRERRR